MAYLYREKSHQCRWESILSTMAGDHLTRGQNAVRALLLVTLFALMALPILMDLLLH